MQEKIQLGEKQSNNIDVEYEKVKQLIDTECDNQECKKNFDKLKREFNRRAAYVAEYMSKLSKKSNNFEWFIVPAVTNRTDFGYNGDIDVKIVYSGDEDPINYKDEFNEEDNIYLYAHSISRKRLDDIGEKYPEVAEWYKNMLAKPKLAGADSSVIDVLSLEDNLRGSISGDSLEKIRQFRLSLAEEFINKAKKQIDIKGWNVSGSTSKKEGHFSFISDLDLEILIDPIDEAEESDINFYLIDYLQKEFAQKYNVKMDFTVVTVSHLQKMVDGDNDRKKYFEKVYNTKF